jgi:hypothetical protein
MASIKSNDGMQSERVLYNIDVLVLVQTKDRKERRGE